jgi:hypothetical protein
MPRFFAKLQQTATLANENCDRATALVRTLSAELRDAQQRIRALEFEAKGRQETEAALAQLQAEFDAESDASRVCKPNSRRLGSGRLKRVEGSRKSRGMRKSELRELRLKLTSA